MKGYFAPCRYGSGQRPLLPYEPHLGMDMTSSGESSSGFTSQDSTMERCKTGILPTHLLPAQMSPFSRDKQIFVGGSRCSDVS